LRAIVRVVNMHEAKSQLSRLVQAAVEGVPFIIARGGKPLVKVVSLDAPVGAAQRTGFLRDISVPPDFDRMGADEIERIFGGRRSDHALDL
jgi:prevent-host-death family protein